MDVINDNALNGTIKPKQIESISGCMCPKCKAPRREPFFFFDDSDDDSYNEVDYWFHRRDSDEADYVDDYADYEDVADFDVSLDEIGDEYDDIVDEFDVHVEVEVSTIEHSIEYIGILVDYAEDLEEFDDGAAYEGEPEGADSDVREQAWLTIF